ncbi:MAG: hypothetical protein NTV80_12890 [Verrucomicrobia bacterium]|nr:hypothetical protein [Verrucomicrobiota bacterium]
MFTRNLLLFLCLTLTSIQAATDSLKWPAGQVPNGQTNGPDTLDDVWQGVFNAWALDPNGDADSDGCSNSIEAIVGTNPFVANDCLKIGNMIISGANVVFTMKVEAGKKYRVLQSDSPNGPSWTAVTMLSPINGTIYIPSADGANVNLSITRAAGSRKFYRVETSDVDTDSDGVSDWAERKLGLNPAATDSDLDGVADGAFVTAELGTPDVVTISAVAPFASEDSADPAEIVISRTRKLLSATVNYTTTGTATVTSDFSITPSTTSIALPAGTLSAAIDFTPIADALVEGGESVTLTLTSATNGTATPPTLGTPNNASIIITNATAATGTGLMAYYYDTASTTAADAINFGQSGTYTYTRGSPTTTGSIVIPYTGPATVAVGNVVKISFTSGNLNNGLYNHANYNVTAVNAGVSMTLAISGATALPTNSSGNCSFSFQSFPHPAVITRVDPVVNNDWQHGTPNGGVLATHGAPRLANFPDDYSDTYENAAGRRRG